MRKTKRSNLDKITAATNAHYGIIFQFFFHKYKN